MPHVMTTAEAENLTMQALTQMTQDLEILGQFLAETGLSPQDLRTRLSDPDLHACLLDYILGHEDLLNKIAGALQANPKDFLLARLCFPGAAPESYVGF